MHDIPLPRHATLALYADDTAIISQSEDILKSQPQLQASTDVAVSWFNKCNLCLTPTKSEAKIFSLKRYNDPPEILINNSAVNWNSADEVVKYLGILLDKKI
jgi:hypothetical protein